MSLGELFGYRQRTGAYEPRWAKSLTHTYHTHSPPVYSMDLRIGERLGYTAIGPVLCGISVIEVAYCGVAAN